MDQAWCLAMSRVFQANLAFQRQNAERERRAAAGENQVSASSADSTSSAAPMPNGSSGADLSTSRNSPTVGAQEAAAERTAAQTIPPAPKLSQTPELLPKDSQTSAGEATAVPLARTEAPRQPATDRETAKPATAKTVAKQAVPRRSSRDGSGKGDVVAASHTSSAGDAESGLEPLEAAIKCLESESRQSPQTAAELNRQARLRLLYLAAGRREDALRPVQPASPAMQDSWSQMIFGLATWMDTERIPDSANRAAETRQQLVAAANRLGELAPLVVRNVSLVREVKGYGDLVPFEKTEFVPGQEVILYAEVENFKSEETPKGYRTGFHGSYEIFDARGQRVSSQELGNTDEYCRNQRRDFYLNYLFCLPKRIYSGRHTLKLTVEDLHGQKIGQSSLEFTVKASGE